MQACSCRQGDAVGAGAGAQGDFPQFEVLLELRPFLVGGFSVFRGWPRRAAFVQEAAVGADQVVLEDRDVGLGGGDVAMSQQFGRDVHGQPVADGFGGEHAAEIVRGVTQRLPGQITQIGAGQSPVEQVPDQTDGHDRRLRSESALEQVRQRRTGDGLVAVVSGDEGTDPPLRRRSLVTIVASTLASSGLTSSSRSSLLFDGTICSSGTTSPLPGSV